MCPHCRTNAPIVYRGVMAYCTACGAPRVPLVGESVNLAGKPAKVGGTITKVLGWLTLVGGVTFGLMVGLLFTAIFSTPLFGIAFGLPIVLASAIFGYLLLRSGKSLGASGSDRERDARVRALFALARHQGGNVRAAEASRSLGVTVNDADAILTDLAKTMSDLVTLELDDAGGVYYRMRGEPGAPIPENWPSAERMRVDTARPRVDTQGSQNGSGGALDGNRELDDDGTATTSEHGGRNARRR